ncbi:DUF4435 domain-containing protein, partial [Vibrio splendidus]
FADRDFNFDYKTNNNIYFTPCYSIENLYVGSEVLDKILCDEVGICSVEERDIYNLLHGNFEAYLMQVNSELLNLNAWLKCQIELSERDDTISLNLNNTKIEDFLNISCTEIKRKYDLKSLNDKFKKSATIDSSQVELASNELVKNGEHMGYRGKYMLEFFSAIINRMLQECNIKEDKGYFGVTRKNKFLISQESVLSTLSQYAITPVCLTTFLEHHSN